MMFPPDLITKLGLMPTANANAMFCAFQNIYLFDCDSDGNPLPAHIYMIKQIINGETIISYTTRGRILMGRDLSAHLN